MRILLVEDEKPVARLVKRGLESDRYAVDVAYDGEQAQTLVDEADFDLVDPGFRRFPRLTGSKC